MSDTPQLADTETTLVPPAPTPLAALHSALPRQMHAGCETPQSFSSAPAELDALLHGAAAFDLGYRTRILITGSDRLRWLNGMVTNSVQSLPERTGNYTFILNAQGRIQGDGYVYREADFLLLDTDRSQAGHLMQHLDHFIIMDDVELHLLDSSSTAIGIAGPDAPRILSSLGLPVPAPLHLSIASIHDIDVTVVHEYGDLAPRFALWFEPQFTSTLWQALLAAGALPAGIAAVEALRILSGTPLYGTDLLEKHLAQETGQTRALNFNKGCYLGQEIVERIRSRASVHRGLRQFALSGTAPSPGIELRAAGDDPASGEGRPIGNLTSIATYNLLGLPTTLALGVVRIEPLERRAVLQFDGGTATALDEPPHVPAARQTS
jgi:folate-binding protein YgfZ